MRKTTSLDGRWRFRVDPRDAGIAEGWMAPRFPDSKWWQVAVPNAWDSYHEDMRSYDSTGWFRRRFAWKGPLPRVARLEFGGAGHLSEAWLNGKHIGEHEGSYCPFVLDAAGALKRGENLLAVRVRNVLTPTTLPRVQSDWFKFGGITRPVGFTTSNGPFLSRVTALVEGRDGSATCGIPGRVMNPAGRSDTWVEASIHPIKGGRPLAFAPRTLVRLAAGVETRFLAEIPAGKLPRWEPGNPRLLALVVTLRDAKGAVLDRVVRRIGIRTLEWGDGRLLLNGKPVWLRGVNRMDEGPDWNCAFTRKTLSPILKDIRDGLHGNFLRASHYPHHPLVPEMLDEMGMMMLAEVPEYQNDEHPGAEARGMEMLDELFWRDAHHPSVVIWSVGNEREPRKKPVARAIINLIQHMQGRDPSRPVSYVSNTFPDDPTLSHCDVLCLNEYFGFWRGTTARTTAGLARTGRELGAALDGMHKRLPRKPIVVTEFGVQAFPFRDNLYGSEDWQAENLATHIRAFMSRPFVQGCAVWSHQDTRLAGNQGYPSFQLGTRLLENFGLLTLKGRRRPSWHAVAKLYGKLKASGR